MFIIVKLIISKINEHLTRVGQSFYLIDDQPRWLVSLSMPLVCWTWDREFKRWLHWWLSFYPQHSATYVVVPMHFQTIQILIWQVPRTFYKLWIYYTSLGSSEEVIVSNLSIIINNKYTIIDNNKLIWTFIVFWMKISLYMDRKESLLKQVTITFHFFFSAFSHFRNSRTKIFRKANFILWIRKEQIIGSQ